jgi:hypothetical protein
MYEPPGISPKKPRSDICPSSIPGAFEKVGFLTIDSISFHKKMIKLTRKNDQTHLLVTKARSRTQTGFRQKSRRCFDSSRVPLNIAGAIA